jgi:uncharacterized protein (UPF0332 family)
MAKESTDRQTVKTYLDAAHEALAGSQYNFDGGHYAIAVNRAYYATFPWHCPPGQVYAANALLATQGLARGKHSGTISAFRQSFVKPGLIEAEYSDIYGSLMDDRHISDYDMDTKIEPERAESDVQSARKFVARIETYLRQEGWL